MHRPWQQPLLDLHVALRVGTMQFHDPLEWFCEKQNRSFQVARNLEPVEPKLAIQALNTLPIDGTG